MSREVADRDRQAAAYWSGVAQQDRSEARTATANAQAFVRDARREDETPMPSQHHTHQQRR